MSPVENSPANPNYRQVCSGETGHVEVLHFRYDKRKVSYEQLVRYFFQFHDPTTFNKQGNDKGTQYASTIFYHNDEQKKVAEMVSEQMQDLLTDKKVPQAKYVGFKVVTKISPAKKFFPAHKEHQEYLMKNPKGYCNHRIRFKWDDVNNAT
mmetsp:Transcript_6571/g.10569  ORF Transcript_6571/g.10569 Transcript_6571/m.10569 type:complete len:151 (+) Transcript_6571:226-678(+)|eukprot:CAMPEP_0170492308 /NCGR_PEP_ID=MMETSP0208-20121228/12011_1 /TAXON_ID=197538 /ORGANISM="Strombidium inclinatum, Strain S3" /LENGTH=150 /DNA_ID=CAMNT_0010768023 /DNA_START=227 /DNA_END=682 /DNA_ORIENTATION=+